MPKWLAVALGIVGAVGGVVGALGGFGGYVAWSQFRHQQPIESHEAVQRSFERQIASAEKRGDGAEVEQLRRGLEGQEEAWRAQQGVQSRISPGPLTVDQPIQLAPEQLAELRRLLQASQPLLVLSARDYYSRGNAYFQLGDYRQALAAYDRAIALRPEYAEAHHNRGVALRRLGRHEEALAAYDQAISLLPDFPEAHYNRGVALGNLGRYEEELAAYDRAIALRTDYPEAHNNRGVALGSLGRFEEALTAYDRAIALRPDFPEARYNKAGVLSRLARWAEALEQLTRAIGVDQSKRELARTDPVFQRLREHPQHRLRFWALVGQQ
jgi:tetratricopeptide (TPR) repeat protein